MPTTNMQHEAPPSSDEIDLRELFSVLWAGKLWVALCVLVCALAAASYAFTVQEWWTTEATVAAPSLVDYADYSGRVEGIAPLLSGANKKQLKAFVSGQGLFNLYIATFNRGALKKAFIGTSPVFEAYLTAHDITDEKAIKKTLRQWSARLQATKDEKTKKTTISFQSVDAESSFDLLMQYQQVVERHVRSVAKERLKAFLSVKLLGIERNIVYTTEQAHHNIEVDIQRLQYAATIARAAGAAKPMVDPGTVGSLGINLGYLAIEAKVKVLQAMKKGDLNLYNASIGALEIQRDAIKAIIFANQLGFKMYDYGEAPEMPDERDSPNRVLMVLLGGILGGLLGVILVLLRWGIGSKKEADE